ncbi:MAG: glutamate synthase-related protein, partial [Bacillota bacterium]|nr:glutamate synthase-related protein [Bacillota bacterium]
MSLTINTPEFLIERNNDKCINCQVCVRQCANSAHYYDEEDQKVYSTDIHCVNCHRCVCLCPTHALTIKRFPLEFRENSNWTPAALKGIYKQAETGGILLTGMGNDKPYPIYWDKMLLNASQVTNPSIDPLREPMELKTYIGRKPEQLEFDREGNIVNMPSQLEIDLPVMFSAMSFGSISLNTIKSLAKAAQQEGTFYNTGEGGLHKDLYQYGSNTIVQVASGRFGVHPDYLNASAAIEIKIGQGAKPGIGGHLPGEKVGVQVSQTRMIPEGSDAISPAPHHDIYSIEDLRQLIYSLKEATRYEKPILVKIAAVHNVAAIASGIARAGADAIVIDGFRGGTGAAPLRTRDSVGIPIELALAAVDDRLRAESIRGQVSIIVAGSVRNSSDVVKAIALGA